MHIFCAINPDLPTPLQKMVPLQEMAACETKAGYYYERGGR
jgi:hypothetical protein